MDFQLASQRDDPGLRALLGQSPMPGWIRLTFGRDPDFFQAVAVQGKQNQVLTAIEEGQVVGMGCRSIRPAYVNGQRMLMGYLGGLRLAPRVQGTGALARGYGALKALHDAAPVPAYTTMVVEDNQEARTLLTSGRAGLPHYLDHGRYFTYAINVNRRRSRRARFAVRSGGEIGIDRIVRFMGEVGSRRQFFPVLETADFGTDYLRGLRVEDFRVAVGGEGDILGVAAAWDQGAFKQTVVQGYAAPLLWFRLIANAALRLAGFRPLPRPGETLRMSSVAFLCVRDDGVDVATAILERMHADQQDGDCHFLILGFHERDPLRQAMESFPVFRYASRLYLVCWDDGLDFVRALDPSRIPHLEVATL